MRAADARRPELPRSVVPRTYVRVMLSGGYGVALTAAPICEEECPPETWSPPAGVMRYPTRLGELLPPGARNDAELAEELARIGTARSRLAAYEAQLIRELAARRPAAADPRPPGVPAEAWDDSGISDFLPDEVAMICNCSRAAAPGLRDTALTWTGPLTATWAALADGRIDPPRARALAAELGRSARETDPGIVAAVEAAILPRASSLSVRRLRARIRAELIARDDAAAERRRREAERAADVRLRRLGDGLTELAAALPTALASACREAIDGYARLARAAGEPGTLGQLRAGVLADLIL